MPQQFDKGPVLPSATKIAAETQKGKWAPTPMGLAMGVAGGVLGGLPGAIGGYRMGNQINSGVGNAVGGFSGFGGTGTGAAEGASQSGYAAGSPYGGYNTQVARNNFNQTVGAGDAQTVAYFDYQNAKARGSYTADGQYTGQGYGGAGAGVSQEARDSIDFSGPGLF